MDNVQNCDTYVYKANVLQVSKYHQNEPQFLTLVYNKHFKQISIRSFMNLCSTFNYLWFANSVRKVDITNSELDWREVGHDVYKHKRTK
jgi:hypothetical protein